MKRKLTEDEIKITEKSIKRIQEEVKDIRDNMEYNLGLINMQREKRTFEDNWRDYLRERKDKEDDKVITGMQDFIQEKEETVKELERQLKEGVETLDN